MKQRQAWSKAIVRYLTMGCLAVTGVMMSSGVRAEPPSDPIIKYSALSEAEKRSVEHHLLEGAKAYVEGIERSLLSIEKLMKAEGKSLKPFLPLDEQSEDSYVLFDEFSPEIFAFDCGYQSLCNVVEYARALSSLSPMDLGRIMKNFRIGIRYLESLDAAETDDARQAIRDAEMKKYLEYQFISFNYENIDKVKFTLSIQETVGLDATCDLFSIYVDNSQFDSYFQICD